ncbi:MAG: hypothetical protein IT431_09710 [Phycisphaerales bacterium]|nr:hypothetical protein [Phycisphaerales bacterium]
MNIRRNLLGGVCAAAIGLGAGATDAGGEATLGPPAVCVPVECEHAGVKIADASEGAFATVRGYTAREAMRDGLAALADSEDVLSHMETVRRVVVNLGDNDAQSNAFLAQLLARAAEAEAEDAPPARKALAWFDAGFFAGASGQMGTDLGWKAGHAEGVAGLGWLERALGYAEGDREGRAAIHFAAATVAHPAMRQSKRDLYELHMREAIRGAAEGSFLKTNLDRHADSWDESLDDLARGG